jgi:alpha-ketoglutaric semialdehyde dehydrogenase
MQLTGEMLIGGRAVRGVVATMRAVNPATGAAMEPAFGGGSAKDVAAACELAEAAFDAYRAVSLEERARFLEAIAQGILDLGDVLVERVMSESGLPRARVEGERARTAGQLRMFAGLVREGRWIGTTIDRALPERKPLPRVDLRAQKIPLGPVAVFGASNFPLAFSVGGGDTASALAAGCPVVAKSHPSHLGTSELVGRVILKAVKDCGLHEGVFSLVLGEGNAVGEALVLHPAIQAVGFTGSRRGGRALVALAAGRDLPIPVYAEMSSINPVFLLPGALTKRAEAIGSGLIDSVTLGVGQMCTKPGVVVGVTGEGFARFRDAAQAAIEAKAATTMLNAGIHRAYCHGTTQWEQDAKVRSLTRAARRRWVPRQRRRCCLYDGRAFPCDAAVAGGGVRAGDAASGVLGRGGVGGGGAALRWAADGCDASGGGGWGAGSDAAAGAGADRGAGAGKWVSYGSRGRARDGAWRAVAGDVGYTDDVGGGDGD